MIQKAKWRARNPPAAKAKGSPALPPKGCVQPGARRRAARARRPALITRLKARLWSPEARRARRTRMLPKLMARMPTRRTAPIFHPGGRMVRIFTQGKPSGKRQSSVAQGKTRGRTPHPALVSFPRRRRLW